MALIAQAATLESRVPFLHFFDGFRTSHELNTLDLLSDAQIRAMIDDDLVRAHRARALDPEHPFVRGTAHNPDTFFQARETVNPFYARTPGIVQAAMDRFAALDRAAVPSVRLRRAAGCRAGHRHHGLRRRDRARDRRGPARARREGRRAAGAAVSAVRRRGVPRRAAGDACAPSRVLEQTKEPGAPGEPLYLDVVTTLAAAVARGKRRDDAAGRSAGATACRRRISARRWQGGVRRAGQAGAPRTALRSASSTMSAHTSLDVDPSFHIDPPDVVQAVFYGLGADGTVGANKNSVKIIAEDAGLHAQGYFVYDSHKSGAQTDLAPALRPAADPRALPDPARRLRRLPPVQLHASAATCCASPRPARRSCSTARTARTRCGTSCRAPCSSG